MKACFDVTSVRLASRCMNTDQANVESAARRYMWLASQFRLDAPTSTGLHIFHGPRLYPSTPGLLELRNAVVLAGEWFVLAGENAYCDAFMQTPSPPLSAYLIGYGTSTISLLCEPPLELPRQEGFLLGGCANYFHWLIDILPRLGLYRSDCGPLFVNGPLQPFQTQSLVHLGISVADLVPLDYPRAYAVRKLFYPVTGSAACMPPLTFRPTILQWLRDKFGALRTRGGGGRRLFISRAGDAQASGRRLINEAEIAGIASDQGFEIIRSEELPFETQVTLFSEASVIAGPHGAGFVNMIFAPEGTKIIEMIGPRYNRDQLGSRSYVKFASILRQNHARIVGHADESVPIHMNHLSYETYTIDPTEFRKAIGDCSA
jgi:hypothetical protein